MKRVFALAVLAAACSDRGVTPPQVVAADSADQLLDSMANYITRAGVRVGQVQADSAWMYQDRGVFEMKGVHIVFYDRNGAEKSRIVSKTGTYQMRSESFDARGDVVATNTTGKTLKTQHLVYDRDRNQIVSDSPYTVTSPQGNASGKWFESDPEFQNIRSAGVKGREKGRGFIIPGQTPGPKP